jgi:hypothetical protein
VLKDVINIIYLRYWLSVGAQPSDRVAYLLAKDGIIPKPPKKIIPILTKEEREKKKLGKKKKTSTTAATTSSPSKENAASSPAKAVASKAFSTWTSTMQEDYENAISFQRPTTCLVAVNWRKNPFVRMIVMS